MIPLLLPIIIDRVFEFLGVLDVNRCKYVCKLWCESALRRLEKCPATDVCRATVKSKTWSVEFHPHEWKFDHHHSPFLKRLHTNCVPGSSGESREEQIIEFIIENREMNKVGFNSNVNPLLDSADHWYLVGRLDFRQLPKFKIDNAVRNFLVRDIKCMPSLCLLRYYKQFGHVVEGRTFHYPTILIKEGPILDSLEGLRAASDGDERLTSSISTSENFLKPRWGNSCFEGIHISHFIPGLKIIITDWSNPRSSIPNVSDVKFPIKSVLYLATQKDEYLDGLKDMKKLLEGSESILFVGAIVADRWDRYPSEIFFVNRNGKKPKPATKISIAFAGRGIRCATQVFNSTAYSREDFDNIKLNFKFPTDSDRAVGFFFYAGWAYPSFEKLKELLPRVELIRLCVWEQAYDLENLQEEVTILHIVWF